MRISILKLDKEYELRFSTMALLRLERELGKPIVEAFQEISKAETGLSMETMFMLIRCCSKELSAMDVEEVADLIDEYAEGRNTTEKFRNVIELVVGELRNSLTMVEEKGKKKVTIEKAVTEVVKSSSTGGVTSS